MTDTGSYFTLKFWLLFRYFFDTKCQLSIAFYMQTDN